MNSARYQNAARPHIQTAQSMRAYVCRLLLLFFINIVRPNALHYIHTLFFRYNEYRYSNLYENRNQKMTE